MNGVVIVTCTRSGSVNSPRERNRFTALKM